MEGVISDEQPETLVLFLPPPEAVCPSIETYRLRSCSRLEPLSNPFFRRPKDFFLVEAPRDGGRVTSMP